MSSQNIPCNKKKQSACHSIKPKGKIIHPPESNLHLQREKTFPINIAPFTLFATSKSCISKTKRPERREQNYPQNGTGAPFSSALHKIDEKLSSLLFLLFKSNHPRIFQEIHRHCTVHTVL